MTLKETIQKRFGDDILRRSALNLPDGAEIIEEFMKRRPINVALEIGTFRGVTSAWMSQFCEKLVTIDLKDGQYEDYKNKFEWANTPARHEIWKELRIKNIRFFGLKSDYEKKCLIELCDFDFAFIDGDHSFEGVAYDFKLVKKCGRVLFHDYDKAPGKDCPVRDFIKTIYSGRMEYTKDFAYWVA